MSTLEDRQAAEALRRLRERCFTDPRAEAARQLRAENAARVAAAHALAMAVPPPPLLSLDALRDLRARQRSARARSLTRVAVTPGFEGHPRTMQEVLARAAAHQARADAR
jgi:hypothetical protein